MIITKQKLQLDNTTRSSFERCPRLYYWEHVRKLRPKSGATPLRFGAVFHDALEQIHLTGTYDKGKLQAAWDKFEADGQEFRADYRTFDNLIRVLEGSEFVDGRGKKQKYDGYLERYATDKRLLDVVATEVPFKLELCGGAVEFVGRIDMLATMGGMGMVFEHKTTGMDLGTAQRYQYRVFQTMGYQWAALRLGHDVQSVMVNMAHASSNWQKKIDGYGGLKVDFGRYPQYYSAQDLQNWEESFCYTASKIKDCLGTGVWPMQCDGCYKYNSECIYSRLCEQVVSKEDVVTVGFYEFEWTPLDGEEK